ncbi:MAG: thioredoxin family protein [Candidatus Omnitrophica bacterium]|nr:thioredoxin family protein [Candidatus Omnitrophota bacterium]
MAIGQIAPDSISPGLNQAPPQTASMESIGWIKEYAAGMAQAEEMKKPVFIDFFATWCGPCRMMDEITFRDRSVIAAFNDFTTIKVDTDKDRATAFKYQVAGIPRYIVLNIHGEVIGDQVGFVDAEQLTEFLAKTKAVANEKSDGTIIRVLGPPAPAPQPEVVIPEDATPEALLVFLSDPDRKTREKASDRILKDKSQDLRRLLVQSLSDDYLGMRIAAWEALREIEGEIEVPYSPWDLKEIRLGSAHSVAQKLNMESNDPTEQLEVNP